MNASPSPIRILAVDDHPIFRQGIVALLSDQADMRMVAEASNGKEAIQQYRAHRPDVTLMDLQMPEMTGLELQHNLAHKGIRIPTIIITAHDESGMRERCQAAGAIAYLAKPLQDTSLFAAIDAAGRSAKN